MHLCYAIDPQAESVEPALSVNDGNHRLTLVPRLGLPPQRLVRTRVPTGAAQTLLQRGNATIRTWRPILHEYQINIVASWQSPGGDTFDAGPAVAVPSAG